MRSTNFQRAVVVGIFVFVGITIFIITVLTLGSQHKTFEKALTVKSYFPDVNGLQKGNNVWFQGVKVGTIRKVSLKKVGMVEVDIDIELQSVKYIPKDALVRLSTDGLIGNKIIEIYGGSPKTAAIQEGDLLGNEKQVSTDEMMNTLSKNNDNLYAITNNFKLITGRMADGKGTIGKLLNDETMIDQLNATVVILQKASVNLEKLTANVSVYTARLNEKGTLANDLVTDTVIFSKLRSTVTQLQQVADSSQSVIANFANTGKIINNGLQDKNTPAGMLLNDQKSANTIKVTLQNLQSASKKLDEDLEAVRHNFLLKGYFKKKAKNEKNATTVLVDTVVTN